MDFVGSEDKCLQPSFSIKESVLIAIGNWLILNSLAVAALQQEDIKSQLPRDVLQSMKGMT